MLSLCVLSERNQILRIGLDVMKYHKHAGGVHVVHNAVVQKNRVVPLGWWSDHGLLSAGEVPGQHSAEVHELLSILIGLGVGVVGGITGLHSKV